MIYLTKSELERLLNLADSFQEKLEREFREREEWQEHFRTGYDAKGKRADRK